MGGVPICPEDIDYDEYDPSDIPEDQAKPEELPTYTEAPAEDYDDYDPNDIPEDQAKPEEVTEGYSYPVPENPLVLPTKPPLPECVPAGEEDLGDNPYFLDQGVPVCPEDLPAYTEAPAVEEYDEYDPSDIPEDQAKPEEVTEGYNYPVPENPLVLPTRPPKAPVPDCVLEDDEGAAEFIAQGVPLCPEVLPVYTEAPAVEEYDDYDPNDIPEDQAKPEELPAYTEAPAVEEYDEYDPNDIPDDQAAPTGYNYPVPENPLQLPSRARKAKLVVDKEDEEEVVTIGLTHLDEDTYDPGNYDHNSPDYLEEVEEEERSGIEVIRQGGRGSSETGVSLTGPGHVISFHVPKEHLKMMEKQQMVMREDFGTERHVDPFSSLLGGE